jgi:sodium transport system permease protein
MWTMAGALHPAIDLTAGEKERGTMETLLISPAERSEIVSGKFLAVWLFSYVSALCNLFWMGGGALVLSLFLPNPIISLAGLAWASLFAVPLAALFSAVAIGLGVLARSSKEGQYYLVPLFLTVMPLCLWSMAPGVKISLPISFVPITGLTLVLQRLMAVSAEPVPVSCYVGVLISLVACVTLSLWWAAKQFHRESVLFREAERLSLKAWLRTLGARK